MSSYIPPIENPEAVYRLHIYRTDRDGDRPPVSRWETFEIPWVVTMTVVEALEWLWDQGAYVAFRANCREFTCGSCAMLIDGKPGLACDTPFADGMRLEPLNRYPVKRDLVVDTTPVRAKWQELEIWPKNRSPDPIVSVPRETIEGWHRSFSRCIECYSCLEACPASPADHAMFAGPMWMLQIARARAHPRDGDDRLRQAVEQGIGSCVSCYECAEVCPVQISPASEIQRLRSAIAVDRVKAWAARLGLRPSREPVPSARRAAASLSPLGEKPDSILVSVPEKPEGGL
jgi:succinate dehydrogenase/fumarate reductase iron-sulfur protein